MTNISLVAFWAGLAFLLLVRTRTLLAYFQQEDYDWRRFSAVWISIRLFDVMASLAILIGFLAGLVTQSLVVFYAFGAVSCVGIALRERRYRFKKPFVRTGRAARIETLALGFIGLVSLVVFVVPVLGIAVIQAVPLALIGANAVMRPQEERRNQAYIAEASAKLAGFKGIRIGITGSFGKTSVKHVLAQMLAVDGNVFYSRGSINTVLGLTRHIRQRLQASHRYFLAEMGAYGIGSIARLCQFVQPEIGVITAVGEAHLERFGSLEHTAKAKAELAEWVCAHGKLVVVTEAVAALAPFANLIAAHRDMFMICGTGKDCDVQLMPSALGPNGREMRVKIGRQTLNLVSPLLADYNALNICLCLAVVSRVAPDILKFMAAQVSQLEQVPHRLEKKEGINFPLILDDAYNANETGFREALAVLRAMVDQRGGRAVLVTPGIVELGASHDGVHAALGTLAGQTCDDIYAVNADRIPTFVAAAKAAGHAEVKSFARLSEARAEMARSLYGPKDVILYENDLPDVLEDKRVL